MGKYDVIIAGASFAGLAVASKIKSGKVLLVDQKEIGVNCKSACGTLLDKIKSLGLEGAVLQVHKKIVLHTSRGTLAYFLQKPFCVIDPKKLTQGLFKMGKAEFLQAAVLGVGDNTLRTNKGDFQAKIFVDASGPDSVSTGKRSRHLSFGLETILDYQEEGFHLWYEPRIFPKGVFWLFPQGKTSRFGAGSYLGKTNLLPYLDEFLRRFGLKKGKLHGGYFPHRLKEPVIGNVFLVGDSAGQCLPISGEGIRPAIVFGQKCGEIIEKILSGKISLEAGLNQYKDFVLTKRFYYEIMYFGQKFLTSIPESLFFPLAFLVSKKPVANFVINNYLKIVGNG